MRIKIYNKWNWENERYFWIKKLRKREKIMTKCWLYFMVFIYVIFLLIMFSKLP